MRHYYDAVIVGAGGAGLSAALQLTADDNLRVAVLSKLYPTRSHTGAAQGGISASIGNVEEDSWLWHMFDTVKGGDYLGDQDAIEVMCREAPDAIFELEHFGLPFSRTPDGRIDQRRFGGHTRDFGKEAVRRACYARDRTGHMILQTLYQQCVRLGVTFFDEFHMVKLLTEDDRVTGVVAAELLTGQLHVFQARAVMIATGGYGRVFRVTSNAFTLTGDGAAVVLDAGLPLEDVEFYQFHPTGIHGMGILITEGARGEGGVLRNDRGERFMKDYAPSLMDLAPRDLVARAIYQEVRQGRGINGQDYVYLDLTHLSPELIHSKLPDITDFVQTYLGIDPTKEMIPVQPTAHYAMGGIPTDVDGRVRSGATGGFCRGLYAAGESACVSIHGANRLGTNSLLELVVLGRRAGRDMKRYLGEEAAPHDDLTDLKPDPLEQAQKRLSRLLEEGEHTDGAAAQIRTMLQETMTMNASVFRTEETLRKAQQDIAELRQQYKRLHVADRARTFNMELWEAVELGSLLTVAEVLVLGALARTESRGAHSREDFPERDDEHWLKHTFARQTTSGEIALDYRPVSITRFEPKPRVY